MKKTLFVFCLSLLAVLAFSACADTAAGTVIRMEMTADYDDADPFIHEKLIYVTEDTEALEFDAQFAMKGESGMLEIADNETGEVFWSRTWNGDTGTTEFSISVAAPEKEREYVIRFTGTGIKHAKVELRSGNSYVKERVKPLRKEREPA